MYNTIDEILKMCLGPDNKSIEEGEKRIENIASNNFGDLLTNFAQFLADENKPTRQRQLCATLIKNLINFIPQHKGKWGLLHDEQKILVKNHTISCLASDIKDIRKAAALTVAGICKFDLPRGEWPDIMSILISTATHENINYRLSSITTIGYIAQEIIPGSLSIEEVNNVLNVLTINLNDPSEEVIKAAISSLLHFIIFTSHNMEIEDQKTYILKNIYNCLNHNNLEIRIISMQCLVEISRLFYESINSNIDEIVKVTKQHMINDDEKVSIQAYEFWCSISDAEIERINAGKNINFYSNMAINDLFEVMSYHLLNRDTKREKEEPDSWTLVKASTSLLQNLCLCCDDSFIDNIFQFIANYINNENPKIRDSALLAFGSILASQSPKLKNVLNDALNTTLNMLNDSNLEVKTTAAWCIKKICEHHSSFFATNLEILDNFMNTTFQSINNEHTGPKVIIFICDSLHHLVNYFKRINNPNMKNYIPGFINEFLRIAFLKGSYDVEKNVAMSAMFTLGSFVDCAPKECHESLQALFPHIVCAFESANPQNMIDKEQRYAYQAYLATALSAFFIERKVDLDLNQAEHIYNLIKNTFNERNGIYEEGIMAISSLALSLGNHFIVFLKDFGGYLVYGLEMWNDASICRICINSVSDLIRSLKEEISPYLDSLFEKIIVIIEKSESEKILKVRCFLVISDLYLTVKDKGIEYYPKIINIILNAMQAALFKPDADDQENIEYLKSLRERLLECLITMIFSLNERGQIRLFDDMVPYVITFLYQISEPEYDPSIEILINIIGLIGDLCKIHESLKQSLNIPKIKHIIQTILSYDSEKYSEIVEWANSVIMTQ